MNRDACQGSNAGFTLLELMVVLSIMALTLAAAGSLIRPRPLNFDLKRTAREVATLLKVARSHAVLTGREALFSLNTTERLASADGVRDRVLLAPCIGATLVTAKKEIATTGEARVRFFPDGSSTGGRLTLTCESQSALLDIDWMTGSVTVAP